MARKQQEPKVVKEVKNNRKTITEHNKGFARINTRRLMSLDEVRAKRNDLLTACDWTQLPDVPLSLEEKRAWAEYRQVLRDLPQNINLENPTFPIAPN